MEAMQGAIGELQATLAATAAEVANLRAESAGLRTVRDDTWTALKTLPDLVTTLQNQSTSTRHASLVDSRGIGKPHGFNNDEKDFLTWVSKVETYITGVFPRLEPVLLWASEKGEAVTMEVLEETFGELSEGTTVENIDERSTQLYSCVAALTEGESYDIVR